MKTRRHFLATAAAPAVASGFPAIVKAAALGLGGATAPSDRVTLATIGCGGMGNGHINAFTKLPHVQYVAVCDVDDEHLTEAKEKIDKKYGNKDCAAYRAFEEVLFRRDIDAVTIATPDHWHGIAGTMAARAGKDIYGEKPLAHSFAEGLSIVRAVEEHKRIWQTGSWQRSKEQFHRACELVRNGRLGKIRRVEVGLPDGPFDYKKVEGKTAFTEPPATFLYDRWLGPAPEAPYCEARCHWNWRWNLNYGGGQLMDWVGHHVDIAHWGLGFDHTGPYQIEGKGEYPPVNELWNAARRYRIHARYPGDIEMVIAGGYDDIRSGTRWIGEHGWIWVDRRGIEAGPESLLSSEIGPNEIHLTRSTDHYAQFIECVKSRKPTLTPASVAHRSATPGWLGQIAMLTGRKLRWDAEHQQLLNDEEASKMLSVKMRSPYQL
ncbi:MAG: Gfo/Idh/MocA family oxidoreductase [Bryobacterales bacterium]|nr:Gfo/Idh/MocA family oxidoreductase [Bryobacterales bacterium]